MHWSRTERRMMQWAGPGERQGCHTDLWWMREKSISHQKWGEVNCKERCSRILRAIHLAADKLSGAAEFWGEERKNRRIKFIMWSIISRGNIKICQQHPRWGRGLELADGICQLLNQAWRRRGPGFHTLPANSLPTKFWRRPDKAEGISWWRKPGDSAEMWETSLKAFLPYLISTFSILFLCASHF